jgi:hypothetical protein
MTAWMPSVSSLYRNVEVLAAARSPRSCSLRLGLSWGFGLPNDVQSDLTEFSFPLRPAGDLPDLLRRRGGLGIRRHDDPSGMAMHDYLHTTGEPAVAVVDSFHLPYRPAYGRVHSSRTIIVAAAEGGHIRVDDCWEPTYRGLLRSRDLDAARRSRAEADPLLEPIFSGVQADAEWFTVSVEPVLVDDLSRWAATTIGVLVQEITGAVRTVGASFGLAALREMVEVLAEGGDAPWQMVPRRTLALVLRAELSSRRYLCTLLGNAVTLVGQPTLVEDVELYREGLRHFQAARDVLVKSLRHDRAEYDEFVLARCRDALSNEERLLAAITAADLPAAPAPEEAELWPA